MYKITNKAIQPHDLFEAVRSLKHGAIATFAGTVRNQTEGRATTHLEYEAYPAMAEKIMAAVGKTIWIKEESLMDAVTAVSGSGPAYFFYVMQAIHDAAVSEGLDAQTARLLSLETALGAARLAVESMEEPGSLQKQVTSPGGTTEAAIKILDDSGVRDTLQQAVSAARARGGELAKLLDRG